MLKYCIREIFVTVLPFSPLLLACEFRTVRFRTSLSKTLEIQLSLGYLHDWKKLFERVKRRKLDGAIITLYTALNITNISKMLKFEIEIFTILNVSAPNEIKKRVNFLKKPL